MDAIEILRDELRRSLHGPAWHGLALLEALDDVSPAEAHARPLPGAHTIAEIALHALAWTEEVARRVAGAEDAEPARGDWPPVPELDPSLWTAIKGDLAGAGAMLDSLLSTLPAARLNERARRAGEESPGPDAVTYAMMLHGLSQHNAYHGGQVSMLKRSLRQTA
jgi:uncharacterized damage-inducible protein DinB